MKKSLFFAALVSTSSIIAGNTAAFRSSSGASCGSCCNAQCCTKPGAQTYIGKEAAIAAALSHAGFARNAVRELKCELNRENGIIVYEVEFESGFYGYEYDIDAVIGKILKSKKERD